MKTKNKKNSKKVTLTKEGQYWIVSELKHGTGKHRLFSSEFRALEAAETIWPDCECVYAGPSPYGKT